MIGTTIAHYRVLSLLGRGGMGEVYKAWDTRLKRAVALKILQPDGRRDASLRQRFLREARSAAALNHPGILTIHEIGTDADIDFIAMECVEGGTLADILTHGPLPVQRALRLAVQVADALAAAHAVGLVHRDLKPSNIMCSTADRAKLVDFGLAKYTTPATPTVETAEMLTAADAVVGTTPYMSPEQASGRPLDGRSDLFSLGTTLYEMLTGHRPFEGSTNADTVAAILRDTPAPIPRVSPEVARIVERCLRKEPDKRFQTAGELRTAIEACLGLGVVVTGPSIAVLPFRNMSGETEDSYLCEGLAEEIINALTRVAGIRVIARTSAFAVARAELDIREIGARLEVDNVLQGSVRRAGNRVRVTAQLVTTGDGAHLWSERYDREMVDVLNLEDEIAATIASRLQVDLAHGRDARRPAVDIEAHSAYLEGRYYFARGTPESLAAAKACYERAIAVDPGSALAYDSLAELYWYLGFFGSMPPREAFSQSTWHAVRALELDDALAETHALLGMLRKELDYNWAEVDRELSRALDLSAESPLVHLRHAISGLLPHGRVEEAMAEVEHVLRADPLSLFVRWWLGTMAFLAHRYERVIEEGRHIAALDSAQFFGHWLLGMGLDASGSHAEAVAALERAHGLSGGSSFTLGFLAYGYGSAGRSEDAHGLLQQGKEAAVTGYVPPSVFALGYIGLGEWDAAFEWMDRAIETRDPIIMPIRTFPFLDSVRGDVRYGALLKKMNLDWPEAPLSS